MTMDNVILMHFEMIMLIIGTVVLIELTLLIHVTFGMFRKWKRRKARKKKLQIYEDNPISDEAKMSDDGLEIIDLDKDDFTFFFI